MMGFSTFPAFLSYTDWSFCDVGDDVKIRKRGIMILIKCKHVNPEVEGSSPADII